MLKINDAVFSRRSIDRSALQRIYRHFCKLRRTNRLHGLNYERCAELPFIIELLQPSFSDRLDYLDIGSGGESPLPTYLLLNTQWDISCIDKFSWVNCQREFAASLAKSNSDHRFHVYHQDLLNSPFSPQSFDIISNVSVIEHFEGTTDSQAMVASSQLLRDGGIYVLTTLINEGHFKEYYVKDDVYGEEYKEDAVFYQRHYDIAKLESRIVTPSGLKEVGRIYFGDFGFQCFERIIQMPLPRSCRMIRGVYKWATPFLARQFLSYSDQPLSSPNMSMNTASGVITVLTH